MGDVQAPAAGQPPSSSSAGASSRRCRDRAWRIARGSGHAVPPGGPESVAHAMRGNCVLQRPASSAFEAVWFTRRVPAPLRLRHAKRVRARGRDVERPGSGDSVSVMMPTSRPVRHDETPAHRSGGESRGRRGRGRRHGEDRHTGESGPCVADASCTTPRAEPGRSHGTAAGRQAPGGRPRDSWRGGIATPPRRRASPASYRVRTAIGSASIRSATTSFPSCVGAERLLLGTAGSLSGTQSDQGEPYAGGDTTRRDDPRHPQTIRRDDSTRATSSALRVAETMSLRAHRAARSTRPPSSGYAGSMLNTSRAPR